MLSLVLGLAAAGCDDGDGSGSRSGVDRSKYLDELSATEIQQLCSWSASILRPGSYTCTGGATMNAKTTNECADSIRTKSKHCLVSLTEDCVKSAHGAPCLMLSTEPCRAYASCALSP